MFRDHKRGKHTMAIRLATLVSALALALIPCYETKAAVISYSDMQSNFGEPQSEITYDLDLPLFTPSLGQLDSVTVTASYSVTGLAPPDGGGWEFGMTVAGPDITATAPGNYNSLSDLFFFAGAYPFSFSPLDGPISFAFSSALTFPITLESGISR
jgi:hypothetical protein